MRIELEATEQRVIQVVLPKKGKAKKGRVIEFEIKEISLDDLVDHENKIAALTLAYTRKEINVKVYLFGVMDKTLKPSWHVHKKALGKLTLVQLTKLQKGLLAAAQEEDPEEKKTARKSA